MSFNYNAVEKYCSPLQNNVNIVSLGGFMVWLSLDQKWISYQRISTEEYVIKWKPTENESNHHYWSYFLCFWTKGQVSFELIIWFDFMDKLNMETIQSSDSSTAAVSKELMAVWTCTLTLAVRSFNQVQRTLGNDVAWSLSHSFSFAAIISCDTSLRAPGSRNTGLTQDDWAGDVHLQTQRCKIRLSLQKVIRKTKRNHFICVVKQLINMINMLLPINTDL